MIIRVLSVILGVLMFSLPLRAQNILFAVEDGTWTSATTDPSTDIWSTDAGASVGEPGLRPTSLDDVFTNRRTITIGSGAACKNLAVSYDQAGGVSFGSVLLITGTLGGWDDVNGQPAVPTVNVFSGNPIIRYTGANLDGNNPFWVLSSGEVIGFWNKTSPLGQGLFQLTRNVIIDGGDPLSGGVIDGELQFTSINIGGSNQYELSTGSNLTGVRISGTGTPLVVGQNTRFVCTVPVYGTGTSASKFAGTATISGYLATSSYFNATTVNINSNGRFETSFSGADQTEGWWYQNSRPSISTSTNSTVAYTANADQNVFLRDYSNLNLSGSGIKSLAGSAGTLSLSRSLTISSSVTLSSTLASRVNIGGDLTCDGSWQPTSTVNFNGSTPAVTRQTVSGSGTLVFSSLEVSNTGIPLALNFNELTISNGVTVGSGSSLNLGSGTTTISGGNISNAGTITSGAGSLSITSAATTLVTGVGSTQLNNVNVSAGTLLFETAVSLNNLTTGSAGTVTFNSSPTFSGNITNSGSLEISTLADMTFTGGSSQNISGNGFTVYNMIVSKSAGTLSNNTAISLLRNLSMTGGTFDADGGGAGNFVLVSDTNGDATIGTMTSSTITGQVTFQRYFNNTVKSWRHLGFPVKSVSIADLSSSITIGKYSISYYDETAPGDVNQGWSYLADGNLFDKLGYSVYMYSQSPITISVKGELLQNVPATAYNFAVTYFDDVAQPSSEDGWNLVANPFACPIDWNDVSWTKTRVNGVAAIWDASTLAYRNSGTAGWDGIIAPGQAVWVQTNGSNPSLLCTEDAKRPNLTDVNFYRETGATLRTFGKLGLGGRLSIMLEDDVNFDETIVHFAEAANPEFDPSFDAHKLKNQIFNLSSLTPAGSDLAINVLPQVACRETIRLKVSNINPGSYSLKFDGLDSFSERTTVSLRDNFTGKAVPVDQGSTYKFDVTSDPLTFGVGRFELTFDFNDTDAAAPAIERNGRKLTTDSRTNVQWLFNGSIIPTATESTYIAVKPGEYQVQAIIDGCLLKSKVIDVDQSSSRSRFYPNPVSSKLNVDVFGLLENNNFGNILLYSSKGEVLIEETFDRKDDVKVLDVKDLKPGVYILKAFSGSTLLVNERIVIKR